MPGISGNGFLGVALETTSGTYLAPTKFVPIQSESLSRPQDTIWRRPIRQTVDVAGAVAGNARVEGDISMEAFEDIVALFLCAARATKTKTGTTPNFTYAFVGNSLAIPANTMSITVVRNGQVFGFVGCVVSSFSFSVSDGQLMFNVSILGRDEATQTLPTATWGTGIQAAPYGAGSYNLQIPTATQVFDTDNFTFSVEDNAAAQYRLSSLGQGAQFAAYGERSVTLTVDRDFETRADYDNFKALTAQSITLIATKGANNSITVLMPAAIKDTYETGLSGQGDLIRASVAYNATLDATLNSAYQVTVKTQQDIT
jgi:hypothetical protein